MSISRPLILVVGMHRSGTSLVGGLLQQLGAELPGQLIPGDQHNPDGYHEWQQVVQLQEQLLKDLQRWWPSENGLLPLPADWLWRPETQAVQRQLQQLLEVELGQCHGPWVIKDPRTTLLLPLWRQLASQFNLGIRLLLCLRDPAEVIVSLCRRDGPLVGMTPQRARMLWWHHHRRLLLDRGDLPTLVVRHGDWFDRRRAQIQLLALTRFAGLPEPSASLRQATLQMIQPAYRRSFSAAHHWSTQRQVTGEVRRLWRRLGRGMLTPPRADLPRQRPGGCVGRWLFPRRRMRAWFCADHYRQQLPELDPLCDPLRHYCRWGWQRDLQPHPLFDPVFYRAACAQVGLRVRGNPLRHYLHHGRRLGLRPGPWVQCLPPVMADPPSLQDVHPRGAEALGHAAGDPRLAVAWLLLQDQTAP